MATPTIYKQRPHPEIVIHNRQPYEVLGWFDATHYTLTDGKRKFAALATECSEPPKAKEQKPETAGAPEEQEKPEDENPEDSDGREETPTPPAGTKPGKTGNKAK